MCALLLLSFLVLVRVVVIALDFANVDVHVVLVVGGGGCWLLCLAFGCWLLGGG